MEEHDAHPSPPRTALRAPGDSVGVVSLSACSLSCCSSLACGVWISVEEYVGDLGGLPPERLPPELLLQLGLQTRHKVAAGCEWSAVRRVCRSKA